MTSYERVKAAINWRKPDRIPLHEDFWTDTPEAWRSQGFRGSIEDSFDFDIAVMYLDCSPRYEQKILERKEDNYIYDDRYGYRAEKPWQKSGSIHYLSVKTKDRETWEQTKSRWTLSTDPGESARIDDANYFEHFDPYPSWGEAAEKYEKMREKERYILFKNYGPWEATWRHRDFANLLMDIALEPDWVKEMGEVHTDLTLQVLEKCLDEGMKPDGYFMVDDLGSSNGPLMSPAMWRSVYKDMVRKIGEFLKANEIDFWMHSCGNGELLFEDLMECGVKVMNPLQVSAGLDIREMADRYRGKLAFYGNIDAHILDGPWEDLEEAILSRREIFRNGGWICHSDHSIPPTMSLEQFMKLIEAVRNL